MSCRFDERQLVGSDTVHDKASEGEHIAFREMGLRFYSLGLSFIDDLRWCLG